jgi:hypothetical protein
MCDATTPCKAQKAFKKVIIIAAKAQTSDIRHQTSDIRHQASGIRHQASGIRQGTTASRVLDSG